MTYSITGKQSATYTVANVSLTNGGYTLTTGNTGSISLNYATGSTWINYDPDSAKGRANRKKYCKPWDPTVALEKIIKEFPVTEEI